MIASSSTLLLGEVEAIAFLVKTSGFEPLLDHLHEDFGDIGILDRIAAGGARGDFAILDGGADQPKRRDATLVLGKHRVFESRIDLVSHG